MLDAGLCVPRARRLSSRATVVARKLDLFVFSERLINCIQTLYHDLAEDVHREYVLWTHSVKPYYTSGAVKDAKPAIKTTTAVSVQDLADCSTRC